jgi:Carboxypeptidase regulatory-like domain
MGFASRRALALAVVVAALAIAPQPLGADQPVAISGTVSNWNKQPLAGADVYARTYGKTVWAKTDERGRFAMLAFTGQITIEVRAAGYAGCSSRLWLTSGDEVRAKYRLSGNVVSIGELRHAFQCDQHLTRAAEEYDRYVVH